MSWGGYLLSPLSCISISFLRLFAPSYKHALRFLIENACLIVIILARHRGGCKWCRWISPFSFFPRLLHIIKISWVDAGWRLIRVALISSRLWYGLIYKFYWLNSIELNIFQARCAPLFWGESFLQTAPLVTWLFSISFLRLFAPSYKHAYAL